jgi:ribosome maturation factor RimP
MDLQAVIGGVVEADGLELVEVTLGRESGRRVLRVMVERPDGPLDLDAIATASERISRRLDLEGFEPGPYSLEVSSPGIERPLHRPRDFMRRIGDKVKLRVTGSDGGAETITGAITRADDEGVTIGTESDERAVSYSDIVRARTVFEWGTAERASSA